MTTDQLIAASMAMVRFDTRQVIDLIGMESMTDLSAYQLLHADELRSYATCEERASKLAFMYRNARQLVLE